MPNASIIIPAFNASESIGRTLSAVLAQSDETVEIIVVDDGSTDDTAEIVKRFPVKYIGQENRGPASARNLGAQNAQREIIIFLDSDCVPQAGWLQAMTAPFENPEISGVKGRYITRQKSLVARFVQLEFEERYRMLEKRKFIDFVDSYSAGFRQSAFQTVGSFDESFPKADNEDVDLSYKLANAGYKMVYAPSAVVEHTHPSNVKKYLKVKFGRGYWRTAVYRRHPSKALVDSYTPQTLKLQIFTVGLFWLGIISAIFSGIWEFVAGITALFLLLVLPFILENYRLDITAVSITPFMFFLRANCFLFGVLTAILKQLISRNKI
jgi:glycosyltransferase involved in cell wall biosynthesis